MTKPLHCILLIVSVASLFCSCTSSLRPVEQKDVVTSRTKEVLLEEYGKARHWVIRSGGLIVEEHGLTAHGDLHVVVEYPKGVRHPQLDSLQKEANTEANTEANMKVFWPSGRPMSLTPQIGARPDGRDVVWWPNGQLAREAAFSAGIPIGIWKFYDESGQLLGEGKYENGERQSGVFVGSEGAGADFFFTMYPMKKQVFENGVLKKEEEFLKELRMQ